MKLIPLDAVVAEIEKVISGLRRKCNPNPLGNIQECMAASEIEALNLIKDSLDTLEVKEVDLKDEIDKFWKPRFNLGWDKKSLLSVSYEGFEIIAKHFFELGLQARHDNWKVVDNTNIPQADRNKIYCVFTKGRYILAKVINHPEDEELLQWKCTEFSHHRYDMCEGDKYMQIV